MDSVGGIQVGDRVLLRHGSVKYAALLKKHGFPPSRTFRVLEVITECNALRVDTRRFDSPATSLATARGNPYEVGGQINQPDLTQGEPNVFLVNQILEARREKGKWKY
eukprot:3942637-Pleurochrysis_carterae.AAC.1